MQAPGIAGTGCRNALLSVGKAFGGSSATHGCEFAPVGCLRGCFAIHKQSLAEFEYGRPATAVLKAPPKLEFAAQPPLVGCGAISAWDSPYTLGTTACSGRLQLWLGDAGRVDAAATHRLEARSVCRVC